MRVSRSTARALSGAAALTGPGPAAAEGRQALTVRAKGRAKMRAMRFIGLATPWAEKRGDDAIARPPGLVLPVQHSRLTRQVAGWHPCAHGPSFRHIRGILAALSARTQPRGYPRAPLCRHVAGSGARDRGSAQRTPALARGRADRRLLLR